MGINTYSGYFKLKEFNQSFFEPKNIDQGISNGEVPARASLTSAVRYFLIDIHNIIV